MIREAGRGPHRLRMCDQRFLPWIDTWIALARAFIVQCQKVETDNSPFCLGSGKQGSLLRSVILFLKLFGLPAT